MSTTQALHTCDGGCGTVSASYADVSANFFLSSRSGYLVLSDLCASCFHKAAEAMMATFPDGAFTAKDFSPKASLIDRPADPYREASDEDNAVEAARESGTL